MLHERILPTIRMTTVTKRLMMMTLTVTMMLTMAKTMTTDNYDGDDEMTKR